MSSSDQREDIVFDHDVVMYIIGVCICSFRLLFSSQPLKLAQLIFSQCMCVFCKHPFSVQTYVLLQLLSIQSFGTFYMLYCVSSCPLGVHIPELNIKGFILLCGTFNLF